MKLKFRKTDGKYFITTLLLISLMIFSIKYNNSNSAYKQVGRHIDGETLFSGIFFGNKKVGSIIPELNQPDSILLNSERKKLLALTISNAKMKNEFFFNEFKQGLESGDPAEVDASLAKAEAIVNQTIDKLRNGENGFGDRISLTGAIVDIVPTGIGSSGIVIYPEMSTEIVYPSQPTAQVMPGPMLPIVTTLSSTKSERLSREKYVSYLTKIFNMNI